MVYNNFSGYKQKQAWVNSAVLLVHYWLIFKADQREITRRWLLFKLLVPVLYISGSQMYFYTDLLHGVHFRLHSDRTLIAQRCYWDDRAGVQFAQCEECSRHPVDSLQAGIKDVKQGGRVTAFRTAGRAETEKSWQAKLFLL